MTKYHSSDREHQFHLHHHTNILQSNTSRVKTMERFTWKAFILPGMLEEYIKRHDEIWPELSELIRQSGVSDYSIFLDEETNILFAVQKQSGDQSSQDLGTNPVVRKWWDYMSDIMECNPDKSPVTIPLTEVFYLE